MGDDDGGDNGYLSAHDDSKKTSKHVRICDVSSDGLLLYCDVHGVSLTAMVDALGHVLGEIAYDPDDSASPRIARAALLARRIDVARRRRPK